MQWGGGILGTFSPLPVPCILGPVSPSHAYSLEGLGAALPAAPLQPGAWRGCLPGFHLSLVLFLFLHPSLAAMAHHFWHHLPSPSRRRQPHFQPRHCWLSQPSLLPRAGTKNGVWEVWACGHQGLAGCLSACLEWTCSLSQLADLPLLLASRWAELGFSKIRDSFISESPLRPCAGLWTSMRPEWPLSACWVSAGKSESSWIGHPHPPPQVPPRTTGFLLFFSRAEMGLTKPGIGHLCPQRDNGLWRNRFMAPLPQACCPSLSALNKVC